MRRFATLLLDDDEKGTAARSSQFWQAVCGDARDVWEVFQCHKGVIPDLDQIAGSAGILVAGSNACFTGPWKQTTQRVKSLLVRAVADESLLLLATGGAAEVVCAAIAQHQQSPTDHNETELLQEAEPLDAAACACLQGLSLTDCAASMPWICTLDVARMGGSDSAIRDEKQAQFLMSSGDNLYPKSGMPVLAVTQTEENSTPISWLVKSNILVIAAMPHIPDSMGEGFPDAATFGYKTAGVLGRLARAFMSSNTPQLRQIEVSAAHFDQIPARESADRASMSTSSTKKDSVPFQGRPDFVSKQSVLEDCSYNLAKALMKALDIEVQNAAESMQLAANETSTVAKRYVEMDGQVKGMLAFVEALQHKKRIVEGDILHLDRIEEQVDLLEVLVQQLDAVSCDLEHLCCSHDGDSSQSVK